MAKRGRKPKVEVLDWERLVTVEKTVAELVEQHHPHLKRAKILCVGKPKARKSGERIVITTAKAAGPELAAVLKDQEFGEANYLVVIGRDAWNALGPDQKRVELDGALCAFAGQDEKGRWLLQDFEIKGWRRMLDWYGVYNADTELFLVRARQLDLLPQS